MKSKNIKIPLFSKRKHKGIVSPSVFINRFGRRTKLAKLIDHLKNNIRQRKFKNIFISITTVFVVLFTLVTFFKLNVGAADSEILIDDWSTIPAANIDNLDNSVLNELSFGPRTIADTWCDTSTCDDAFAYRKLITINNTGSAQTNVGVSITVNYDSNMNSDFSDIRFVLPDTKSNNTYIKGSSLTYNIINKTDNSSADVIVYVPNLPVGKSRFYIYYGNESAISNSASIKSLYSSNNHKCIIDNIGEVYCWGYGHDGILGNGSNNGSFSPVKVVMNGALEGLTIESMALSNNNTCVIASNHKVYCWGDNSYGQLGNNDVLDSNVPVAVDTSGVLSGKNIEKLSISDYHACVIADDHKVYCWGYGLYGQLGNNDDQNSNIPVAVDTSEFLSGKNISLVYASNHNTFAIDSDGVGYAWGSNWHGALGIGNSFGYNITSPKLIDTSDELSGLTIESLYFSQTHTCAIASDHYAYCWGQNRLGILGSGDTVDMSYKSPREVYRSGALQGQTIKSMSISYATACVITNTDNIYCWGQNNGDGDPSNGDDGYGQLGDGTNTNSNVPVAVDMSGALSGKTIKSMQFFSGYYSSSISTCVIASDDNVYCWGYNGASRFGVSDSDNSKVPIKITTSGTLTEGSAKAFEEGYNQGTLCVLDKLNKASCWGSYYNANLGRSSNWPYLYSPQYIDYMNSFVGNTSETFDLSSNITDTIIEGSLISTPIQINSGQYFKNVVFETSPIWDTSKVKIKIRTATDNGMTDASDWDDCNLLSSGENITSSTCVNKGDQYLQYKIFLQSDTIGDTVKLKSISLKYIDDDTGPIFDSEDITAKKTYESNKEIENGAWSNAEEPYYSWSTATDETDGSGFAGYCLYIGTDTDPDLTTTSGLLMGETSPVDTNGGCQYAVSDNSINFSSLPYFSVRGYSYTKNNQWGWISGAYSGDTINFIVKGIDNNSNLSEDPITFDYQLDVYSPDGETIITSPSSLQNTKEVILNWVYAPGLTDFYDEDSGVAGVKYCAFDLFFGDEEEICGEDGIGWYGKNNQAGTLDNLDEVGDVFKFSDSTLTTTPDNPFMTDNGTNMVYFAVVDNVGNANIVGGTVVVVSQRSSNAPTNLTAIPEEADSNNFSFSWEPPIVPDGSDDPENPYAPIFEPLLEGLQANMDYCWTINVEIEADGSNCNWTGKNVLSLPEGPYATKQGPNILYMMTRNGAGNFNATTMWDDDDDPETPDVPLLVDVMWDDDDDPETPKIPLMWDDDDDPETPDVVKQTPKYVASVVFNTSTAAPGIPENVEVIDVSTRIEDEDGNINIESSIWRLAVSWIKPEIGYDSIKTYRVYRSNTNSDNIDDYTEITSVPFNSYSYIDNSLDPNLTYYYKIIACDSAGACGIASALSGLSYKKPTGHYSEPATISTEPSATDVSTRKATINWSTNRITEGRIYISTSTTVDTSGDFAKGNSDYVTDHNLELDNLQAGTTYYYVTSWIDNGGIGYSNTYSFTTLPAPNISEVEIKNISIEGSTVSLSIENSSKLNIYYGKTEAFGGVVSMNTSFEKSSYSVSLTGLDDGTKYFLRLNGFDNDGNEYNGNVYSFTTLPKPRISNLRFQPVADASSNTTIVSWITNVPASSELSYGPVGGQQEEAIQSKFVTEHEVTISGLIDNTDYTLVARSRDAAGNLAVSDVQTFKTALDTRPPKISNITVETTIKGSGSESKGQVIVSWDTDEPATSQVAYGQGSPGSYSNKTSEDSELITSHTVVISDLSTSSIYQIQPISKDKADNGSNGTNQSAIIGRGSEDVLTIIFNALRNIFGIKA